ncbi:MAG: D-tyrosyl-tRNA(Tyr) deacylase [Lentisphaeria bacterium]|nr:D-tyrosyl-tRNA(Tyr) deacylase [Lentisphaeria bacterium]MBR7127651.1 D-tyrosyl-tRNA(Tyr) deacylase [Lentisphaeria bacterium]
MRLLVQRVSHAQVSVDGQVTGKIGEGLLVLVGVTHSDTIADVEYLSERCVKLRIFNDEEGKMNKSLLDVGGGMLIISQFTLYADTRKGNRPGYSDAANPELANDLYEKFIAKIAEKNIEYGCGVFGADMDVEFCNQGPVTILLESKK